MSETVYDVFSKTYDLELINIEKRKKCNRKKGMHSQLNKVSE